MHVFLWTAQREKKLRDNKGMVEKRLFPNGKAQKKDSGQWPESFF